MELREDDSEERDEGSAVRVAVLLVPNRRNGISADGRMVDSVITFLVDLADEDAGKRNKLYN